MSAAAYTGVEGMAHDRSAAHSIRSMRRVVALLATALLAATQAPPAYADSVVLRGSTTFSSELMAGHLAEIEAASHHTLTVVPNRSNLGLLALFRGEADLAMISTALANEAEIIGRSDPSLPIARLQVFPIARTRAALVVHSANPVRSISNEDLRRVLSGAVTDWRELGGRPLPIRIVAVREGGGEVSSVEAAVLGPGAHISAPNQIRVQNGPQVVTVVEQELGALGITQVKLTLGRRLNQLATTAPIEQQLNLVSLGDPTPAMLDVIAGCRNAAAASGLD